jgi:diketogulonate reductase-like aldo/keto reductase
MATTSPLPTSSTVITHHNTPIPAVGFGTFKIMPRDADQAVSQALKLGYRHIDTAQIYGNESEVGSGIRHSKISRQDIFLTTKVWNDHYPTASFIPSVKESLKKLKTDHVDLLLLHWPDKKTPLAEMMDNLNKTQKLGLTKHIGVSNFNIALMTEAAELSRTPLLTNQIEYHPYLNQQVLCEAAKKLDILITAHTPLARGKVITDPVIIKIAKKYKKLPAQVTLRWLYQQNILSLPKSTHADRARENFNIFDFVLSPEDMSIISNLANLVDNQGRLANPEGLAPEWD